VTVWYAGLVPSKPAYHTVTYIQWYIPDVVLIQLTLLMFHLNLHTTRSPTYSDIYQRLYWYNWLSWWWALGCSKHVEIWNKQIKEKELCVKLAVYKDCNKTHGQQNTKNVNCNFICCSVWMWKIGLLPHGKNTRTLYRKTTFCVHLFSKRERGIYRQTQ